MIQTAKEILVTPHALEKFKSRTRRWDEDDARLEREIISLVKTSQVVVRRPGGAWEVQSRGYSFVVMFENENIVVITFLGDEVYRKWAKKVQQKERYGRRAACWANLILSQDLPWEA